MAVAGKLIKIYVDTNGTGGATATWALIAQQDKLSLKRNTKKVDGTTKDDDGTANDIITGRNWSTSFGGKLKYDDPAWIYIDAAYEAEDKIHIKIDRSLAGGTAVEGECVIDDLEETADGNGAAEYSMTLAGQGSLTAAAV